MSKFIFLVAIIFVSAACGFFIGQQTKSSANSETPILEETKKPDFIKILQDEEIETVQSWDDGDGKTFFGAVRQLDEPCDEDYGLSSCQKLSVYDETGKVIFEHKDFGIHSFGFNNLARKNFQIMMVTNGGGTDDFLKIFDYQNGKFTEIIDESETQMRGGYFTMPEYRSGIVGAIFKPSQIFVLQQIGGSDLNPTGSIFRLKNGKYQQVGEIKMQELGDFIEKQIAKNK